MLWDDIGTPWDRLTILQSKTSWAICAEGEWPGGSRGDEALFNLTLKGVLEAISQRGPYVGQVVWRRPAEWKAHRQYKHDCYEVVRTTLRGR